MIDIDRFPTILIIKVSIIIIISELADFKCSSDFTEN